MTFIPPVNGKLRYDVDTGNLIRDPTTGQLVYAATAPAFSCPVTPMDSATFDYDEVELATNDLTHWSGTLLYGGTDPEGCNWILDNGGDIAVLFYQTVFVEAVPISSWQFWSFISGHTVKSARYRADMISEPGIGLGHYDPYYSDAGFAHMNIIISP